MAVNWRPGADPDIIRERARVYRQIRSFMNNRGCLEVDTPTLMPATNPDAQVTSIQVNQPSCSGFLQTSPEFAMKRLLAARMGSIFQICHAFRAGESGRLHNIEFSLLEWYRVDYDYSQLMDEIELLISTLSLRQCSFARISYRDLLIQSVDIDIFEIELEELRGRCQSMLPGIAAAELDFDQCLDSIIGFAVAPQMQGYQFVFDYPVSQAALARVKPGEDRVAERFELFYDGIELANGFSELTDAELQRARFEQDNRLRRDRGLPVLPLDEAFLAALACGLEDCAGVALGLDRLLMVLLERESIDEVLTFRS